MVVSAPTRSASVGGSEKHLGPQWTGRWLRFEEMPAELKNKEPIKPVLLAHLCQMSAFHLKATQPHNTIRNLMRLAERFAFISAKENRIA